MKATAMTFSLVAAFLIGATSSLAVMKLRMDKLESSHGWAMAEAKQSHRSEISALRDGYQATYDAAQDATRTQQDSITTKYQAALNEARKTEGALRMDLSRARTEHDRLRQQTALAASRINLPETPPVSIAEYATAASELLAECSGEYQALAGAADQHAADAALMQAAWPALHGQ